MEWREPFFIVGKQLTRFLFFTTKMKKYKYLCEYYHEMLSRWSMEKEGLIAMKGNEYWLKSLGSLCKKEINEGVLSSKENIFGKIKFEELQEGKS